MQDKEFDQLFKNTFEDAEIAPSRDLWSSIESKIEPKKKRVIPVYWLSAAAVLLIATVGVLVYQQQNNKPKQFANNIEPKSTGQVVKTETEVDSVKTAVIPNERVEQTLPTHARSVEVITKTRVKENIKAVEKQKIVTAPEMQKQETMIAKVDEPEKDIKEKIADAVSKTTQETVYANNNASTLKVDEVMGENNQSENKSIRNVGDVVNLIVNKVDKRKEKFIQFRTDDDDSSISSINIGPFRFGKKKK